LQDFQRRGRVCPWLRMADRNLTAIGEAGFKSGARLPIDDADFAAGAHRPIRRIDADDASTEHDHVEVGIARGKEFRSRPVEHGFSARYCEHPCPIRYEPESFTAFAACSFGGPACRSLSGLLSRRRSWNLRVSGAVAPSVPDHAIQLSRR